MFYRIEQKHQRTSLKTKPWMLHLPKATATGEKKIANQPDLVVDKRRSKRSDADAQAATTEDPAQAAIATPEEGQQAKKKKKMADEKDGSMVRHNLKLPPPVPRPFCETDFNSITRFLDADDAYVSKVEILIRRAFAKPMRLPKFGSKVKLTDLPIDARMPLPVVCNILYNDVLPTPLGKEELGGRRRTVNLMQTLFELTTRPAELILDFSTGNGSSIVAANNCGRYIFSMEKRTQTLIDCCKATIAAMEVDEAPKKPIAKDSPSAGDKKGKKHVLDDDIRPLFDDDDDDEGDNKDSS
ncbi:hypothetical protein R1sor_008863 [Riccia sorocarpa]|uniref:Uncharacterized protein n=1 Tax=Riccia sorocarpa TaxID=122646 RepID=A0ABD3H832_9MARC